MKHLKYISIFIAGVLTCLFMNSFVAIDENQFYSDIQINLLPSSKLIRAEVTFNLTDDIDVSRLVGLSSDTLLDELTSLSGGKKKALKELLDSSIKTRLEFRYINDISIIYCSNGHLFGPTESFTRLIGPLPVDAIINNESNQSTHSITGSAGSE